MPSSTILSDNGVSSGTSGIKTSGGNDGLLLLQTTTAGGTATTAVTIDTSQNVGIGTSSPTAKLDVNKGSAGVLANFTDGVNTNCQISTTSLVATVGPTAGSTALAFQSSGLERARIDSSGNFQFNSGYGSVAIAYGCRAWVNFNGSTATIRASGNVTSVTRSGVGSYSISLTAAMPDTNYCAVMSTTTNASGGLNAWYSSIDSTTVISMGTYSIAGGGAGAYRDTTQISVAVFR